jgi:alkanesulfonate monooxygenase SsuD/methylene tetrahydromethanopterin reductase-like flavin-dependent oxidoreductase (luciferase family)
VRGGRQRSAGCAVKFWTSVPEHVVLPLHNPVRLAKAIATLDVLSGGRVMVTFGAGMAPGEFSARSA